MTTFWHHITAPPPPSTISIHRLADDTPPSSTMSSAERQSHDPPRRCTTQRQHRPPRGTSRVATPGQARLQINLALIPIVGILPTGSITSNHDEHAHAETFAKGTCGASLLFMDFLFSMVLQSIGYAAYIYTAMNLADP